ncbi:hypothetical protein [Streptomyces sp. NPDC046727]|uniref:hypothetical protein n=1 Tax=Streptomyces sp. NPDC046727 TaxID=3155373 RepID=UPI0033FF19F4
MKTSPRATQAAASRSRRRALLAPVFLLCCAVAGCADVSDRPAVASPVGTPTPRSMSELRLPLNAYLPTPEQQARLGYLTYRVQQVCMQRYGFRYLRNLSAEQVRTTLATQSEYDSRRYGISDGRVAAVHGYRLSSASAGSAAPQPIGSLTENQRTVLSGQTADGHRVRTYRHKPVPPGGCAGEAQRVLHPGGEAEAEKGYDLVTKLRRIGFLDSRGDRRIMRVNAAWSACMRRKGLSYRGPDAASTDARWTGRAAGGTPSRTEIKVALADVSCKYATNLLGVNFAVEAESENDLIGKNRHALEAVRVLRDTEVARLPGLMRRYGQPQRRPGADAGVAGERGGPAA